MRKLIETALPLRVLSASAIGERVRKGHPGDMHLWWNRSPVLSSAALLYAAMIDSDGEDDQRELMKGLATNDAAALARARENLSQINCPTVADCMSGFGGLSLAAESLGLNVEASDLNAVATLLTKAVADIPNRFTDVSAVHPGSDHTKKGMAALAEDVRWYGRRLLENVHSNLTPMYPEENGSTPIAWLWVRTVKCPNPACGCQMPLSSSYVLAKTKEKEYWAEPIVEKGNVRFQIHKGICPSGKESNKLVSQGAKFRCPACGSIATDDYIKKMGKEHHLGTQMMAVAHVVDGKRTYSSPSQEQIKAAEVHLPENLPAGRIAENSRWFSPPGFGMTEYKDLYTGRQLQMLTAFCDGIQQIIEDATADALAAGLSDSDEGLDGGDNGALAYGQATGTYLTIAVSKMTNYHSSVCSWDNRTGTGRAVFTRQAIPMVWTFVEENPFANVLGNFESALESVAEAVARLPEGAGASAVQADAASKSYAPGSVMFAELPYYDNVGYADLSDYFYIWLQRGLRNVYPSLFANDETSKDELSSIPEHYGGDAQKAIEAYERKLKEIFVRFAENASREYPSIVFYEFAKSDERAMHRDDGGTSQCRLATLLQAMIDAGFCITAIWPVRTERPNERFESVRIAVVFRVRPIDAPQTTRRNLAVTIGKELPSLLDRVLNNDIDDVNRPIVGMGFGLSIVTRYKKILNADGSVMQIQDALQLIAQEVDKYLATHEAETEVQEA